MTTTFNINNSDDLPRLSTGTFIGIMVAIAGNVLISLALNIQKLAHRRLEVENQLTDVRKEPETHHHTSANDRHRNGHDHRGPDDEYEGIEGRELTRPVYLDDVFSSGGQGSTSSETQALIPQIDDHETPRYGPRAAANGRQGSSTTFRRSYLSWLTPLRPRSLSSGDAPIEEQHVHSPALVMPVDGINEDAVVNRCVHDSKYDNHRPENSTEGNESDYLKSKLWWFGFFLMNVGECGNFISYAFAPASVVAPLGTFALIANCFFAPLILGERFRKRDLFGIFIAIIGAITVVLSSNSSDVRLDPDGLIKAISQLAFVIYSCVYIATAMILAALSQTVMGRRWVFVDVGLCAIFGGFTVLSTKAISTLLTLQWFEMFAKWITYPVLAVLVGTGIGQIRYLNRALMRFDSKVVIPIQFVLFNLSAIIGSAILYGDFRRARFHQVVTFLYGCAATFCGVFIIAWAPSVEADVEEGDLRTTPSIDSPSTAPGDGQNRLEQGSIGRRPRAILILPNGTRGAPTLKNKRSAVGMLGLSPAKHLLLVHTPPRDLPERCRDGESDGEAISTPDSVHRRRVISWFGEDNRGGSTRESSIVGRIRHSSVSAADDDGGRGRLPDSYNR